MMVCAYFKMNGHRNIKLHHSFIHLYQTRILIHNASLYTVKPVNKGHQRERQNIVFIDKWSLFGGNFVLLYQERVFIYRVVFIQRWPFIQVWLYIAVLTFLSRYDDIPTGTGMQRPFLSLSASPVSTSTFTNTFFVWSRYIWKILPLINFNNRN